jgi:hypothetical protein
MGASGGGGGFAVVDDVLTAVSAEPTESVAGELRQKLDATNWG